MEHIYYAFAIVFFTYELQWVLDINKQIDKVKKWDRLNKEFAGLSPKLWSPEYNRIMWNNFIVIPLFMWVFAGLFTFQWMFFLLFIVISIVGGSIARMWKYDWRYATVHWILSLIGALFAVFVVINKYHLRITL